MKFKNSLLLILIPLFFSIATSCNDSDMEEENPIDICCIPLNLVDEYYLQGYFHFPNDNELYDLYTTLTTVGGKAYPNTIMGDLVLNSDNTFTNNFQVVFERDSVTIDTIQKEILGTYSENHIEGNCDYVYHEGEISFTSNSTTDKYDFSRICEDFDGIPILMWGRIEQDSVILYYYPK